MRAKGRQDAARMSDRDTGRMKFSVVVIAYNDAPNMRACLGSIPWADEIVVVDSFSTDQTSVIAAEYTKNVHQVPFTTFGKLRNDAMALASHDWIFSLDSDERATPEIWREIEALLRGQPAAVAYHVPRKNYFFGQWIRHCGWYPDFRQPQLYDRRRMRYRENELVHESFDADGPVGRLKEHVLQIPFRDTRQFLAKMDRYSTLMAQRMARDGRRFRWHQLISHPAAMFAKMYLIRLGVLDGLRGFILSGMYAYYTYIKYVRLWEQTVAGSPPAPAPLPPPSK